MALFTPEELEELRRADEELDADFRQTQEEIEESRKRDRRVSFERKDNRGRKIAAQKAAYREANKEKIAAQQAAYREANKEKIADYQAAYSSPSFPTLFSFCRGKTEADFLNCS